MYSFVCKEFPILMIVREFKVFQIALLMLSLQLVCMCVIIIISSHFFHCFLCTVCTPCYGCSFFYLRHYFSFSVFNSFGLRFMFCPFRWRYPFQLLSFFGCCRIPTWTVFPLFSLTWRIHHSDHFIKWDSFLCSFHPFWIHRASSIMAICGYDTGTATGTGTGTGNGTLLLFSHSVFWLGGSDEMWFCFCVAWNGWCTYRLFGVRTNENAIVSAKNFGHINKCIVRIGFFFCIFLLLHVCIWLFGVLKIFT